MQAGLRIQASLAPKTAFEAGWSIWFFSPEKVGIAGLAAQIFDNLVGRKSNVRQNFESNRGDIGLAGFLGQAEVSQDQTRV